MSVKRAACMVIFNSDRSKVLAVRRRFNAKSLGFPGGKEDLSDSSTFVIAQRETREESRLFVKSAKLMYESIVSGNTDYYVYGFLAEEYEGEAIGSDEGDVEWVEPHKMISPEYSPFWKYNQALLAKVENHLGIKIVGLNN